tara:strand:+ start:300 stop:758 length:459 start_codon:yes stop_codon:yes gene_type:complete
MNKYFIATLLSVFFSNAFAKDVYLLTHSDSAKSSIINELDKLVGPINTETAEPALVSQSNFDLFVIESSDYIENLDSLTKNTLQGAEAILISGQPKNNSDVAKYLIGYGVEAEYLLIKGLESGQNPELVYFNNDKKNPLHTVAHSIVKKAIK